MFVRIVKMTFKTENIANFERLFEQNKDKIRAFEGCLFLELYQDQNQANIFFTYSYWEAPNFLEAYRKSELFQGVWSKTKMLFSEKPEAWSVTKKISLP